MTEQLFLNALNNLEIELTQNQINTLKKYAEYLLEYNEHTNLTAIKNIGEVYLKHFYDSLTLKKVRNFNKEKILDIGTGAGFPGLVLAIVYPNTEVYLLDSNHKKIDFLNEIIEKLQLKNAFTIYERAEEHVKKSIEQYDIVTSRAVKELRIILEISFPALKINGSFLAMKSSLEEELQTAQDTIEMLNGKIINKKEFELPYSTGKRTILEIQKMKSTNKIYPRSYSTILKKPLKKKNN